MKNQTDHSFEAEQLRFGARIRHLRLKAGLSQEDLADKSGLDRTYVGGIERGERNPSLKNITRLALALQVGSAAFFEPTEESFSGEVPRG
jgi:transcriptional regulator with XRE-family HTH domain